MDSKDQHRFLEEYRLHAETILEPTRIEAKTILNAWKRPEFWGKHATSSKIPTPSPVQRTRLRIKRPESVLDKIIRRPEVYPDGLHASSIERMPDALGARVIVYFISQLSVLDREIQSSSALEISSTIPPVAYLGRDLHEHLELSHIRRENKESGYASIHYVVRLRQPVVEVDKNPWMELQLRTLCEDLWGEIEHVLGYKPEKRTALAVRKQFRIISRNLEAIDDHFNFLYEELSRFQKEREIENDDTLNAENIASVLGEMTVGCAQKEIFGMLKILASHGIRTVGALRSLGTVRRIEVIRSVYRIDKGREPANFEVVTSLANLDGVTGEVEMVGRVKAQMAYLTSWLEFQRQAGD